MTHSSPELAGWHRVAKQPADKRQRSTVASNLPAILRQSSTSRTSSTTQLLIAVLLLRFELKLTVVQQRFYVIVVPGRREKRAKVTKNVFKIQQQQRNIKKPCRLFSSAKLYDLWCFAAHSHISWAFWCFDFAACNRNGITCNNKYQKNHNEN